MSDLTPEEISRRRIWDASEWLHNIERHGIGGGKVHVAALLEEVDRLTAQLAEARAKADDWQAMKDERDAARCGYANLLDDTNGEIKGLRAQLAEREGIARELATAAKVMVMDYDHRNPMRTADFHQSGCGCLRCVRDNADAALARFHAAEGK